MKKTLILTLATGFACAMSSMATTYDLYITGATAFRQSVYAACLKLYDTTPATNIVMSSGTLVYGGNNIGNSSSSLWTMTGTCSTKVSALGGNTLNIHGDFNGSVQGVYVTENSTPDTIPGHRRQPHYQHAHHRLLGCGFRCHALPG